MNFTQVSNNIQFKMVYCSVLTLIHQILNLCTKQFWKNSNPERIYIHILGYIFAATNKYKLKLKKPVTITTIFQYSISVTCNLYNKMYVRTSNCKAFVFFSCKLIKELQGGNISIFGSSSRFFLFYSSCILI